MNTSLMMITPKSSSRKELILLGIIATVFSGSVWYSIFTDCDRQIQKQKQKASTTLGPAVAFAPIPPTPPSVLVPIIEGDQIQHMVEMK